MVLHGFREGSLAFRPTFKLDASSSERKGDSKANPEVGGSTPPPRDDDDDRSGVSTPAARGPAPPTPRGFSRKRVPSWCDRVMYASLPGSGRVAVVAYGACHGLTTSDHAPVYASLDVAIRGVEDDDDARGDDAGVGVTGDVTGWEGRLRSTPERANRGSARRTGSTTTTTRVRAAAPPAAATVAVNGLRVVARGFQTGFQKVGVGGSKGGTTTDAEETDSSAPSDKAKSDDADNRGDGGEADSSAAGSDVDAAAAALRRLLAAVQTSTSTSSSTSPRRRRRRFP